MAFAGETSDISTAYYVGLADPNGVELAGINLARVAQGFFCRCTNIPVDFLAAKWRKVKDLFRYNLDDAGQGCQRITNFTSTRKSVSLGESPFLPRSFSGRDPAGRGLRKHLHKGSLMWDSLLPAGFRGGKKSNKPTAPYALRRLDSSFQFNAEFHLPRPKSLQKSLEKVLQHKRTLTAVCARVEASLCSSSISSATGGVSADNLFLYCLGARFVPPVEVAEGRNLRRILGPSFRT
ncbi:predicted protein [Histoplasma capsulatum G186AR]|uniref:Uncharacterized protein n=1 Tax=Ajellomyces capsulatus (strain G186AR / H82 / ATCC MYA-2454 / RMSCC 2432) TaxID=447093 RepID=C0NB96_AJECG|nr:uncharacterized protein HCBG_00392 [Histoplasma capsulatum G186AR]EEH10937.1 predicted protein [Histoplasma capsulatum G186AR]